MHYETEANFFPQGFFFFNSAQISELKNKTDHPKTQQTKEKLHFSPFNFQMQLSR